MKTSNLKDSKMDTQENFIVSATLEMEVQFTYARRFLYDFDPHGYEDIISFVFEVNENWNQETEYLKTKRI